MDLKEYESWLYLLKEEIAHNRIDDAITIINDLILNKKLVENINTDIEKIIIGNLSALSIKLYGIKKFKKDYDKNELEKNVDEILIKFNNLIIIEKINQAISEYYNKKINEYIAVIRINNIKKIRDINYTHQRNFKIYFTDKTEHYLDPKRKPNLSDDLAIAIFYTAVAENKEGKNSSVEISKGISTKDYMQRFRKELDKYCIKYNLACI